MRNSILLLESSFLKVVSFERVFPRAQTPTSSTQKTDERTEHATHLQNPRSADTTERALFAHVLCRVVERVRVSVRFFYNQEYESSSAKGFESSTTRRDDDDAKGVVVLGRPYNGASSSSDDDDDVMFDLWTVFFFWGTRHKNVVVREEEQHQIGVHSGCFEWAARTTTTTTGETGPDATAVDE